MPSSGRSCSRRAPHRIEWHWVKGHSGHPENERADALACDAALAAAKGQAACLSKKASIRASASQPDRIGLAQDLVGGVGIHLQLGVAAAARGARRIAAGLTSRSRSVPSSSTGSVDLASLAGVNAARRGADRRRAASPSSARRD